MPPMFKFRCLLIGGIGVFGILLAVNLLCHHLVLRSDYCANLGTWAPGSTTLTQSVPRLLPVADAAFKVGDLNTMCQSGIPHPPLGSLVLGALRNPVGVVIATKWQSNYQAQET